MWSSLEKEHATNLLVVVEPLLWAVDRDGVTGSIKQSAGGRRRVLNTSGGASVIAWIRVSWGGWSPRQVYCSHRQVLTSPGESASTGVLTARAGGCAGPAGCNLISVQSGRQWCRQTGAVA